MQIFKVQNPSQFRRYESCKKIQKSLAFGSYHPDTENTLYYGCDRYNLETVCKLGFTKRLHKGNDLFIHPCVKILISTVKNLTRYIDFCIVCLLYALSEHG